MTVLPGPVVDATWLAANHDRVRIVDLRWDIPTGPARTAYLEAHIPGAVFADLDVDASAPASTPGGRHPLPTPANFAAAMSRLGIGDSTPVVVYDHRGGGVAARLWFMLDSLGHDAAVLDGGIQAWDGELEAGKTEVAPATFTERSWPDDRFIDADTVAATLGDADSALGDARSAERYRGEQNDIDPRLGHVPGATSLPWTDNLVDGRLRPVEELRARFAPLAEEAATVTMYCGSGVTACHNLLAMRLAGIEGRLYVGSWSDWGGDSNRPLETGE